MKLFVLQRVNGLVMIYAGLLRLFTPFRSSAPLTVAKMIARERGRNL